MLKRLAALGFLVMMLLAACGSSDTHKSKQGAAAMPTLAPSDQNRPDAPAPVDGDFRADPPDVVAATGRPQLLEFFAYW